MSRPSTGKAVSSLEGESDENRRPESPADDDVNDRMQWLDDYYVPDFFGEAGGPDYRSYFSRLENEFVCDEESETYSGHDVLYYCPEEEQDVEKFLYRVSSSDRKFTLEPELPFREAHDQQRKSLFVHSSPNNFSDINHARKSAFGSIFLRTTGRLTRDATLLRSVADSSYSMLHSLLSSFDKIISSASESDRRNMALAYKQSLLKALEVHGISRTYSDGSVHWNIYPIARDYLFSVQVGSCIHQTRLLTRVEERILTGSMQKLRLPYAWPTDSVWTGYWDSLGMAGIGTYTMPHGVSYNGKMQNGIFHDDNATLTYPNKFKALHCVFVRGKLMSCQFQFPDLLMHEKENWGYCKLPDRRFWSEVRNGLKAAKVAQKTEIDPPRKIPEGFYDTSDGFYNPKSLMLVSPSGNLLRVPVCEESRWIKQYCRKGFLEQTGFRPDLYENWFNYDQELIRNILAAQENYRTGKLTYEELQQYYADLNLLPSWSKYKQRKSPSVIALEEYMRSIPEPKPLKLPRVIRKFQGHKIPSDVIKTVKDDELTETPTSSVHSRSFRRSKSFLRQKFASSMVFSTGKSSRINFKFNEDLESMTSVIGSKKVQEKREIPAKYLEYRPVLKPPFPTTKPASVAWEKKCRRTSSSETSEVWVPPEDAGESLRLWEKRETRNYMKEIIMEKVTEILEKERERHRKRYGWAQKPPQKPLQRTGSNERCLKVLEELFESIPEKEEFCDSGTTSSLRKLAEDKYQTLKYWGKRIYLLDFKDKKP